MPDKVPLWIIKNTFCPYGNRLPKRPDTLSPDLKVCANCQREMYSFRDWNFCEQLYYCNDCIDAARAEARKSWNEQYGGRIVPIRNHDVTGFEYLMSGKIPQNEQEIPSGNLPENDYAFWIGNMDQYTGGAKSLRSVCRACGGFVFGDDQRAAHKIASARLYKSKLTCNKVLALSYQQLLKLDVCMVCGNKALGKQKWGVSLCCPNCIKVWKFDDTTEYPALERMMMQYWIGVNETKTETSGSTTLESSSNSTQMSTQEERTE